MWFAYSGVVTADLFQDFRNRMVRGAEVLDVASGRGRHALPLARAGFRVTAMDRSAEALESLRSAATSARLSVRIVQADVENMSLLPETVDGILNARFLYRPLFSQYERALRPDGSLFFETFTRDNMDVLGHPRPGRHFLLEPGELRESFPGLRIVSYFEGVRDGYAMATLVASK